MRVVTEVNGVMVEINSTKMLDLGGLSTFMKSLVGEAPAVVSASKPVVKKRGRGRPAGAKNKAKGNVK